MALRRIQERKERRQKVVISIVISFLMVASGFGIYLSGKGAAQESIQDHGLSFTIDYDNQVYQAKVGGRRMSFYYLPSSVQDVQVSPGAVALIRDAQVAVITFDPSLDPLNLQATDLVRFDFTDELRKPLINAMAAESTSYALPVVTCENATASLPVIALELGEPAIILEGYCVMLTGNVSGFLEVRDRFLYEYYGVYDKE